MSSILNVTVKGFTFGLSSAHQGCPCLMNTQQSPTLMESVQATPQAPGRTTMADRSPASRPMASLPPAWGMDTGKTLTEVSSPKVVTLLWSLQSWSVIAVPLCWCLPQWWGGLP